MPSVAVSFLCFPDIANRLHESCILSQLSAKSKSYLASWQIAPVSVLKSTECDYKDWQATGVVQHQK